jgi:hypothetical protein
VEIAANQRLFTRRSTLAMVALAGVSAFAYLAQANLPPPPPINLAADPACDLRSGPCGLGLPGGGTIRLALGPSRLPVMEPLAITVEGEGVGIRAVTVSFEGVDMNMGVNRFVLGAEADGRFVGNGVLPLCVRNRMQWQAVVLAETERGPVSAPFRFETVK